MWRVRLILLFILGCCMKETTILAGCFYSSTISIVLLWNRKPTKRNPLLSTTTIVPVREGQGLPQTRTTHKLSPIVHRVSSSELGQEEKEVPMGNKVVVVVGSTKNNKRLNPLVEFVGGSTSIVVSTLFYSVLAWQRNGVMAAFFLGSIGNAILSKVLKKVIKQTRPQDLNILSERVRFKPSDGGMPSSHAMSLGFIGTFTSLHQPIWFIPIILVYSSLGLFYRVQVKLHTWEQIVVGVTVGSLNGLLFHMFAESTVIEFLKQTILNEQGLIPYPLLVVPAMVGVMIVGSFERRLTNWITRRDQSRETEQDM